MGLKGFFAPIADSGDQADDGIGTSDDETNSSSSTSSNASREEGENSPNMAPRRVIKLDLAAMSQLLTFDEVSRDEVPLQGQIWAKNNVPKCPTLAIEGAWVCLKIGRAHV